MENNKPLLWSHNILIFALCLTSVVGLGAMMLLRTRISEAQNQGSLNADNLTVNVGTQKRVEGFKAAMLTTWQQEAQAKGIVTDVPSMFQGKTIKAAKLPPEKKVIALTFDDGPWPKSTAQVLDILKKNDIKGTFFVVGRNVKNYPDLTKQIVAEGHSIANHTWHHWYHHMNAQKAAYEVANTSKIILETTGVKTGLFRPPGGIMTNGVVNYARNNKYAVIMWSSDSIDYSRPSVAKLMNNIFKSARPGGIVLMHDGGGDRTRTVQALPKIIDRFRKQGYEFVTIPEMLEMQEEYQASLAKKEE
ncbi:MAG: polysaccharide deacetylase family protein [Sphaerospermopsis sp. SIO1G1]|nr:polysaccharide deacetylase family protein [Sphaerospermopsis sp. SIO1G1]